MKVIDSHTEGEPTRVVVSGGPELGSGSLESRLNLLATKHDSFRQSIILEPRGSDVLVGALLVPPVNTDCAAGVIFFNNTGYLGMCGHGSIGVAITLKHMGLVHGSECILETPVGEVRITYSGENQASVQNVPSYVYQKDVTVDVPDIGLITGDVAWGGNWFFLVNGSPYPLILENASELTLTTKAIKQALAKNQVTGKDGAEIDHIELFTAPVGDDAHSRNFVLCPGDAYDRSPCGTGTSAKLACLHERGELNPGDIWIQESVIGSRFTAVYQLDDDEQVIPTITGRAFITGESELVFHPNDPFRNGIGHE